MYVYGCNAILKTVIKNKSDKEMIQDFTELTKDLKIHRINAGLYFMENEASTALKMKITTIGINHQLVPPSNHRGKNSER